jgi:hypothetical protein
MRDKATDNPLACLGLALTELLLLALLQPAQLKEAPKATDRHRARAARPLAVVEPRVSNTDAHAAGNAIPSNLRLEGAPLYFFELALCARLLNPILLNINNNTQTCRTISTSLTLYLSTSVLFDPRHHDLRIRRCTAPCSRVGR